MTAKEALRFLEKNKKEVEKIKEEFDMHSASFDKKMKELLAHL